MSFYFLSRFYAHLIFHCFFCITILFPLKEGAKELPQKTVPSFEAKTKKEKKLDEKESDEKEDTINACFIPFYGLLCAFFLDDEKARPQISLGVFAGYVYAEKHFIGVSRPSADIGENTFHSFTAGAKSELELFSWFSIQLQLHLNQRKIIFDPQIFGEIRTSDYLQMHLMFGLKTSSRYSIFKISGSALVGLDLPLTRPNLYGRRPDFTNTPFFMGAVLMEVEFDIHTDYSIFISGGFGVEIAHYSNFIELPFSQFFPVFAGVNRRF